MSILIMVFVVIGLSVLILAHEAGHFFCAKFFNVKVEEFGIGFPPKAFSWRTHKTIRDKEGKIIDKIASETEYSVNWLPFGGFVKIAGENGEFELMEDMSAKKEDVSKLEKESVDANRLFHIQPAWKKSIILLAGVVMNFLIGWLLISIALTFPAPKVLIISSVEPNSPAASVGLAQGDIIKNFSDSKEFIAFVNAHRGQSITIDVSRNGKDLSMNVVPRVITAANEGAIGVYLEDGGHPGENFFSALWDGFQTTISLVGYTFLAFWQLVTQLITQGSLLAGVVGPVGIFGVAQETGKIGFTYFIQFLGVISINLAVVNLIPFPALDGGRFLLTIIEKIKGSPVSAKVEGWINGLGFAFLLILMGLLTVRDVMHLF